MNIKKYKRKIIQLTSAILYNCNYKGYRDANIYNGKIKQFCVPGLNCYSCPGAIASCPLGSFQSFIMKRSGRENILSMIPFYVLGLLVIFGVLFGRLICGFLCPFGLIQELLYKIKTRKIKKNQITRNMTIIKYFILAIFVIIIPILYFAPGFCKYICPVGTLEAGIFHISRTKGLRDMVGVLFSMKLVILSIVILMSVFLYRFFCRFICPLGAFYGLFNKISIFGIKVDTTKCVNCKACTDFCLMDTKKVGDRECIKCGECKKVCKYNAIK